MVLEKRAVEASYTSTGVPELPLDDAVPWTEIPQRFTVTRNIPFTVTRNRPLPFTVTRSNPYADSMDPYIYPVESTLNFGDTLDGISGLSGGGVDILG